MMGDGVMVMYGCMVTRKSIINTSVYLSISLDKAAIRATIIDGSYAIAIGTSVGNGDKDF